MKAVALFFLLASLASVLASVEDASFGEFRTKYEKSYVNELEASRRRMIFEANVKEMEDHNRKYEAGQVPFRKGINKFTDMTADELKAHFDGLPKMPEVKQPLMPRPKFVSRNDQDDGLPENFSWRDQGVVTSIKDQGECKSSSAFAVTAAIESCFNIKNGQSVTDDLSEQYLVDCGYGHVFHDGDREFENKGCQSGWPQSYMDFLLNGLDNDANKGKAQTEAAYPYTADDNFGNPVCSSSEDGYLANEAVVGQDYEWNQFEYYMEDELKRLVATVGPVVTTFEVVSNFPAYQGGIFIDLSSNTESCCSSPSSWCTSQNNHVVTVTGYGVADNGMKFWEVKNSWGPEWGEEGYFRIVRNLAHCGFGSQMVTVPKC